MKIDFTKAEYRSLLDVIEIADWVLHAHALDERSETAEYRKLFQKILSFAEPMGFRDLVEFSEEFGQYFPTQKYEQDDTAHAFIDEYDEELFWSELTRRLGYRDAAATLGEEELAAMEFGDRIEAVHEHEQRWEDEVSAHGLKRLDLTE